MSEKKVPLFSLTQRRRLLKLGLIDAQIRQLETVALPVAKAMLINPARLKDVSDELRAVAKVLRRSKRKTARLLTARSENRALFEALQRIFLAAHETRNSLKIIDQLQENLVSAIAVLEHAHGSLPRAQRRSQSASPMPVKVINEALLQGFVNGHHPDRAFPPYPLRTSSSPGSDYREIIGICYEAMGQKTTDPERAIKAFIRWSKKRDARY